MDPSPPADDGRHAPEQFIGKHRPVAFTDRVAGSDQMGNRSALSLQHAMCKEALIPGEQSNITGR
jgi:hypothetical protein